MEEQEKSTETEDPKRRDFLKTAAKVAVAAPAATLLLSATFEKDAAAVMYTQEPPPWL